MGVYERATATDGTKIPIHTFGALFRIWANNIEGKGSWAASTFQSEFSPDATYLTEANLIKSKYDGLLTDKQKSDFLDTMEDALVLAEQGLATKQDVKDLLGF